MDPNLPPAAKQPSRDDRVLLSRLRVGDRSALETLLDLYWTALVTYAARLLGSWDAAEDVAQETFVRIWERREDWEAAGSVSALLYRIARNNALDKRKIRHRYSACLQRLTSDCRIVPTPADQIQMAELEAALGAAVEALPERRRETFLLARVDGLSCREIAEVMGLSPQTVSNQLSAALRELRQALRPFLEGGSAGYGPSGEPARAGGSPGPVLS